MSKKTKKSNQTRCGGGGGVVVVRCGFSSDNNTTLGLCWVALGCGNIFVGLKWAEQISEYIW